MMKSSGAPGVRLQKFLADKGHGSRREIEGWISEGKIKVDGKVAQLGDRVSELNRISIDGRVIRKRTDPMKARVLVYNKPEGEICSRDDPGRRPTVFKSLPRLRGSRWVIVGRLDINTRGVLLFTNSGDLANRLMHPSYGLEREYLCRVFGKVEESTITRLKQGVTVDGETTKFLQVKRQRGEGSNTWYNVIVGEGRYREVRRMWEAVGCRVSRLVRVRYGNVVLPRNLRQGEWSELKPAVVRQLFAEPALPGEETTTKAVDLEHNSAKSGRKARSTTNSRSRANAKRISAGTTPEGRKSGRRTNRKKFSPKKPSGRRN
ncbi:MAG: pseudouridine synthase [Acidiferrobacterales bacterium]|nr:pseudouridine synthase [Acidiferrobacterales bacterium]